MLKGSVFPFLDERSVVSALDGYVKLIASDGIVFAKTTTCKPW